MGIWNICEVFDQKVSKTTTVLRFGFLPFLTTPIKKFYSHKISTRLVDAKIKKTNPT